MEVPAMQASRTTKNLSLPRRVLACLMSAALCIAFAPAVAWGDWDPPLLTITGDESGYTIFTFDFYFGSVNPLWIRLQ